MSFDGQFVNHNVMDGNPKVRVDRRPSIKLKADPHIVVCMPIGDKHEQTVFTCPSEEGGCGSRWSAPGLRIPAMVPIQWALTHMNLVTPLNTTMTYLAEYGRLSAEARQIMTQEAIRLGAKYILYWDDDTLPPPLALYTMHNWMERHPEAGAISAVYTTREEPNEPLIYTKHGEGAAWDFPMGPGAEPVPIFGAGAGFLLARVQAILDVQSKLPEDVPIWADQRTMPAPLSAEEGGGDGRSRRIMWGHDVRFCHLLNKHDWPVYVHGAVLCHHLDIGTNRLFQVPPDAPGLLMQQRRNINTEHYWNDVYTNEGADSWRKYPEMFEKVVERVHNGTRVVELGCGVGILGSKLTAEKQVDYRGFDISTVGVEAAKTRFLKAEQLDVKEIKEEHLVGAVHVIATELMEHLDEFTFNKVVDTIVECPSVESFIFTVPDNCMPPEQVPEHMALFNEELVRDRLARVEGWKLSVEKADKAHLICVLERA